MTYSRENGKWGRRTRLPSKLPKNRYLAKTRDQTSQTSTQDGARPRRTPDFVAWAKKNGRTPTDAARRDYDNQQITALTNGVAKNWIRGIKHVAHANHAEVQTGARLEISDPKDIEAREHTESALKSIAEGKPYGELTNPKYGKIQYELGSVGELKPNGKTKGGKGFLHIVMERMTKDGASLNEAIDTAINVGIAAERGVETKSIMNTRWLDHNGVRAIIALTENGKPIITGYEISADKPSAAFPSSEGFRSRPVMREAEIVAALKDRISNPANAVNADIPSTLIPDFQG